MNANADQRFIPTDLRSQILHFLWSIGFERPGDRDLQAQKIVDALEEAREQCARESSQT